MWNLLGLIVNTKREHSVFCYSVEPFGVVRIDYEN